MQFITSINQLYVIVCFIEIYLEMKPVQPPTHLLTNSQTFFILVFVYLLKREPMRMKTWMVVVKSLYALSCSCRIFSSRATSLSWASPHRPTGDDAFMFRKPRFDAFKLVVPFSDRGNQLSALSASIIIHIWDTAVFLRLRSRRAHVIGEQSSSVVMLYSSWLTREFTSVRQNYRKRKTFWKNAGRRSFPIITCPRLDCILQIWLNMHYVVILSLYNWLFRMATFKGFFRI